MKAGKEKTREDLVERFVKEKARRSAQQFIEEINQKAARDVEARLKFLEPDESEAQKVLSPPSDRCGKPGADVSDMEQGLEELFQRYYRLGMTALNREDPASAAFYLGKCLLLPVSDELKMRQMVRHNLRLALSLRARLRPDSQERA
jgi:hypothetical protein